MNIIIMNLVIVRTIGPEVTGVLLYNVIASVAMVAAGICHMTAKSKMQGQLWPVHSDSPPPPVHFIWGDETRSPSRCWSVG